MAYNHYDSKILSCSNLRRKENFAIELGVTDKYLKKVIKNIYPGRKFEELERREKRDLAEFLVYKTLGISIDFDVAKNMQMFKMMAQKTLHILHKAIDQIIAEEDYKVILNKIDNTVFTQMLLIGLVKHEDARAKLDGIISQLPIVKQAELRKDSMTPEELEKNLWKDAMQSLGETKEVVSEEQVYNYQGRDVSTDDGYVKEEEEDEYLPNVEKGIEEFDAYEVDFDV